MTGGRRETAAGGAGQHLVEGALALLAGGGHLGLAWLDEELTVTATFGAAAAWIRAGQPLAATVPQLVGLEPAVRALCTNQSRPVRIPNIGLRVSDAEPPKLSLAVHWLDRERRYLVVITRETGHSDLELELRREMRARRLAEALVVEKTAQIERTNAELTRANRDLEEFAYVIAHDLNAPLRALRITAELIERALSGAREPAVAQHLDRMRQQARRMSLMMSGLLEYARVGRKPAAVSTVDTQLLLKDILGSIGVPDGLKIETIGAWPTFATLREPLDIVLRNLIENAIKHHDSKRGTIRFAAREEADRFLFEIADDGPGIPGDYHAAVFEPFRRVNDDSSAEGSGIGLALVKRTVELAGGSITLASEPERRRGATFCVAWPKRIAT